MDDDLVPPSLHEERSAVEALIREAFKGVSRKGGTSWSQAYAIDYHYYPTAEQREKAGELDRETSWEDLVDDAEWREDDGMGGFNFLDPIGFAYYLAPAMIRSLRRGWSKLNSYLTINSDWHAEQISALNPFQAAAVARFIRLMAAVEASWGSRYNTCAECYRSYWINVDAGGHA